MSYYLLYEVAVFGGVSRPEVSFGLSGLGISLFFLHMKFTFTTVYYIEFTRAAIPPPPWSSFSQVGGCAHLSPTGIAEPRSAGPNTWHLIPESFRPRRLAYLIEAYFVLHVTTMLL